MSRYHRVWVVYRKELIETLRDRRTLLAMVVVPIVLYPVLMVILLQALKTETSRREAEKYTICVPTEAHRRWLTAMLEREDAEREAIREANRLAAEAQGLKPDDSGDGLHAYLRADQLIIGVLPNDSLWDLVSRQDFQAGLLVEPPPNPQAPADAVNRIVQIIYRDTDPRSEFLCTQFSRILANEADRVIRTRVARAMGSDQALMPLRTDAVSTAGPQQQFAKILAMIVPFLLVTMTVTGAMYPAIDLTAGERERGTLETLAVSPVPVGQIVAGKFGVIVTIAMLSTLLNLTSMTAMVYFSKLDRLAAPKSPAGLSDALQVQQEIRQSPPADPDVRYTQRDYLVARHLLEQESARQSGGHLLASAPIVLLAMIPFAILFGGVMLATCSFARSFKEAQNYMMPVMMAAIIPAMIVSYMPSVKLEGLLLVLPVANVVVLMRELFLGNYNLPAMGICLLSTCLYAATAVAVATKLYGHEAVLFSDVGTYKTLLRRKFLRPRSLPSPAFVLLTIAILFPINFYWQSYSLGLESTAASFRAVIAASQVFIIALPPLLLCWYAKVNLRETFSLKRPALWPTIGAIILAVSVVPISALLEQVQSLFFPGSAGHDPLVAKQLEWFTGGSLCSIVLVFAVLPGICEELLFRGFLLGGLREKVRTLPLILAVGLVFGLYHVSGEKIPIVSLLGMLLTLVCLRCGSIFPAMLVHMANNGLALISAHAQGAVLRNFYGLPGPESASGIHLNTHTYVFIALFAIGLAIVLFAPHSRRRPITDELNEAC